MDPKEMIEKFQCPGCVAGSDTNCGYFKLAEHRGAHRCDGHVIGTSVLGAGRIAIGLPVGFNKPNRQLTENDDRSRVLKDSSLMDVWFHSKGDKPDWNNLNVPVWAMVENGFLFVRTVSPRIGNVRVDVIEGGDWSLFPDDLPKPINVAKFVSEID